MAWKQHDGIVVDGWKQAWRKHFIERKNGLPGKTGSLLILLTALLPAIVPAQDSTYWWNHTVFYEIFVRSFYDSDGDGIGDLRGLIQKLDYLNDGDPHTTSDLGITGIWLMPVCQSPTYHGYDVTDYRDIEADYGSLSDITALLDSAHSRGIKVIIDLMLNHTSSQHPWFVTSASGTTSPYRDWYIWRQSHPGYSAPWGQEVWHYMNGAYFFGLFWSGMPDLNYWNENVKSEMFEVARFWLDTVRVDGFRLDAIKHLFEDGPVMENVSETYTFLEEFRQFYKDISPDALTVGEVWLSTDQVAMYSDGTRVDFCFEFSLSHAILDAVNNSQAGSIIDVMEQVTTSYPYLQYAPFLTNHDQNRVFEQLSQNMDRMKLAAAIYLTLPGVPFMYYGEEIGMIGSGQDENKRTPMQWADGLNAGFSIGTPWHSINANYVDYNVLEMQANQNSLWHWYRKLIDIRNRYEVLRIGDYITLAANPPELYAYARRLENEMAVVLHNLQDTTVSRYDLNLSESNLSAGEYYVTDTMTGQLVGTVAIDGAGAFTGWEPDIELTPKGTAILMVTPELLTF